MAVAQGERGWNVFKCITIQSGELWVVADARWEYSSVLAPPPLKKTKSHVKVKLTKHIVMAALCPMVPFCLFNCYKCKTVLWALFYYLIKFTPLRLAHNESSQYTLTSEIDDSVQKVADCEAGAEEKTCKGSETRPLAWAAEGSRRCVFKRKGGKAFFFFFLNLIYCHCSRWNAWWRAKRTQQRILENLKIILKKTPSLCRTNHNSAKPQGSLRPYF